MGDLLFKFGYSSRTLYTDDPKYS